MKKKPLGDCFIWTGRYALMNWRKKYSELLSPVNSSFFGTPKVVHAVFKGEGDITIGHAFLQDEIYIYEKVANRKKYKVIEIETYYKKSVPFDVNGTIVSMKIISTATHSLEELHELMFKDGGKFGKYGIESDF